MDDQRGEEGPRPLSRAVSCREWVRLHEPGRVHLRERQGSDVPGLIPHVPSPTIAIRFG